MTLVKKARGLQRFMMDCGFWRSRKWAGSYLDEIGLQTVAVSYCNEQGTDGMLPGPDVSDLALALGIREREAEKVVPKMLKARRWARRRHGYEIVGFLDHNPSSAEIEDYRSKRQSAGVKGNHDRWHGSKVDPNCDFCRSQVRSDSDSSTESDSIASSGSKAVEVGTTPPTPRRAGGAGGSPRASGTNPRALAERAEADAKRRERERLEGCSACDANGLIERGDGFVRCDHRGAA